MDDPIWDDPDFDFTLHKELQAVDANGVRTYPTNGLPIKLRGVLLNNPEDMLSSVPFSPNPIPFNLGAMWQVFVQAVDPNDFGGTAVFMGQHYGNVPPWIEGITPVPEFSYTDAEWNAEMARVNFDRATGHEFRAGDLVEIHAQGALYFGGKTNVNEEHFLATNLDFELELIQSGYGLPEARTLRLTDFWDDANNRVLFDQDRANGGEHFQSTRVELLELRAVDDDSIWAPDELVTVEDADGRQFKLHLGLNVDFTSTGKPTGLFNATGIFNQEGGGPMGPGTWGYELWVMNPADISPLLYGDLNGDGFVGQDDLNEVLARWGEGVLAGYRADYNSDEFIGQDDMNVVLAAWGQGTFPSLVTVPEPTTWGLAAIAGVWLGASRFRRRCRGLVLGVVGALALCACLTSSSSAAITGGFVVVTGDANAPAHSVTNDLIVEADTDWFAANLILELSQGTIHQDALLVGIGPPSPALVAAIPALQWDTYVTGSLGLAGGTPSSAGGSVDLGGTTEGSFNTHSIDLNWFTTTTNDIGQFSLGRFTLSEDARGTFALRLDSAPLRSAPFLLSGRIVNGALSLVPEPSALALSAVGGSMSLVACRRRRRAQRRKD